MRLKRFFRNLIRYLLLPLLALLVLTAATFSLVVVYESNRIAREIAITAPDGIQSLEEVVLGGVGQWISIRGEDKDNPVLLFVHGGPGSPEMVPVRHYNRELEKHFVVVNWDQRGAGKSYSKKISPETMSLEQIVRDTLELTRLLQDRFETGKIYLVGHSWGTIVGAHAAQRHPEFYHAYIGVGQAVNFIEAEKISYRFTLEKAGELNLAKAVQELEEIGSPPYRKREHIGVQRKWLFQFGGEVYGETSSARFLLKLAMLHLKAPEYSLGDVMKYIAGSNFSSGLLWDDLMAVNLPKQVAAFDLPVYFLAGRHDFVTVFEKVEEYFEVLEAPHKELIWFRYSAHSPNFEQPDRFVAVLARIKAETYE